ncbi:MAG: transcription repressor NadR [Selenomonadaceae bacterium]|nr:transcription repressor NadR [Selenomonadaceae bacterium]
MLTTAERRTELFHRLQKETKPVSGTELGKLFNVSRQIIVGDIGILRARGIQVTSTPRGYILDEQMHKVGTLTTLTCVAKDLKALEKEITTVVELEGGIRDILIKHPVYGEIRQELSIRSMSDVQRYIEKLKDSDCKPLESLTNGKHYCTVDANDVEAMDAIKKALTDAKILVES